MKKILLIAAVALCAMGCCKKAKCHEGKCCEKAANLGLGTSKFIYNELKLDKQDRTVTMQQLPIDDKAFSPMHNWKDNQ